MTAWALVFSISQRTFYFIPTIQYSWKDCKCLKFTLCIGNLEMGVVRTCVHKLQDIFTKEELEEMGIVEEDNL